MNNLDLWDKVRTPLTEYTKKVTMRGGFTAITPQYLIMLATEQFGPYGAGFGLSESEFDYSLLKEFNLAIHNAKFFYVIGGKRHEFVITNTVEVVSKKGHVDTDYAKKAETNTLSKALSKIGFAADVYMGLFDDGDYMHDVVNEQNLDKAIDKDKEQAKQAQELKLDANKVIAQIASSESLSELEGLFKSMARRLGSKDAGLSRQLTKAKDEAKERIEKNEAV